MIEKKRCSKCGQYKDTSEFYRDKASKDGYRSICKECNKECNKKYYEANKELIAERVKEYYETNKDKIADYYQQNKELIAEREKNYRKENKDKIAEQKKEYYEANKEQILKKRKEYRQANKEQIKEYYETNKDKIAEQKKEYYEANKEQFSKRGKKWKVENSDKVKVTQQRRRARKKSLPNTLTAQQWHETLTHFNHSCANCGNAHKIHMDHFIPLSDTDNCPGTTIDNCIPLCSSCNLSKGQKHPKDFFSEDKLIEIVKYLLSRKKLQSPPTVV